MANLNLKFLRGLQASLPASGTDGYFYLTTDTHRLYTSIDGKVVPVNEGVTTVSNLDALTSVTGAKAGDFFYCTEENILAVFNGQTFVQINPDTGVTSVEVVGEGNAVTTSSYDATTRKLTLTKGETFATKSELDALDTFVGDIPEGYTEETVIAYINKKAEETLNAASGGTSESAASVKAALDTYKAENEPKVQANTDAITAIKDGESIDSFADVETALAGKSDNGHGHAIADVAGLQDALDGKQAAGDYATKTEAQAMADAKDEAIAEAKKAGTDAAAALETYKTSNDKAIADHIADADGKFETKTDAAQKLTDAKAYTDEQIAALPAQTDYTVTITEDTTDSTIAKRYIFSQLGEEIGRIDLAKELVVTSGSVGEVTEAGKPYTGAVVGDKYIELVIANQDAPIYIPAKDLVDIYTAKDGATEVQVAISNTNEISATLVNGGVTEEKLAEGVKTKLNKTWEEVGVAQSLVDELADGQVRTNKEAIDAINNESTGILAQAKSYADGLADNYATADHDHVVADITDFDEKVKAYGYATTAYVDQAEEDAVATAAGALASAKTELEGKITDGDSATLASAKEYADQAEADAIATAGTNADAKVKALEDGAVATNAAAIAKNAEDIATKANSSDVYSKTETYSQQEIDAAVEAAVNEACSWGSF